MTVLQNKNIRETGQRPYYGAYGSLFCHPALLGPELGYGNFVNFGEAGG
jgi:hypothetical protein